jgi:hypothetical protein
LSELGRDTRWPTQRWIFGIAFVTLLFPPALTACTALKERQPSVMAEAIDFDDVWSAVGFPCGGEKLNLLLSVKQYEKELSAKNVTPNECVPLSHVVLHATLPKHVYSTDLPLTVEADFSRDPKEAEPDRAMGLVTVQSADRLILVADDAVVNLTRGAKDSAPTEAMRASSTAGTSGGGSGESAAAADGGGDEAHGAGGQAGTTEHAGSGAIAGTGASAAAAGGGSDAPMNVAGTAAPRAGNDASVEAGSGGGAPNAGAAAPAAGAGGSGSEAIAGLNGRYWFCNTIGVGCICIENDSQDNEDLCFSKPTECCFTDLDETTNCQCYPEDSRGCREARADPHVVFIEKCPL